MNEGKSVKFNQKGWKLTDQNHETVLNGDFNGQLFEWKAKTIEQANYAISRINLQLAHQRLGHRNISEIQKLPGIVLGFNLVNKAKQEFCEACILGKSKKKAFPIHSKQRTDHPGDKVWFDIFGPQKELSLTGEKYFITFTEGKSRKKVTYLIKERDAESVLRCFKDCKFKIENKIQTKIKKLHGDNATEFLSKILQDYLFENGIEWESNVSRYSEQNGISERGHRTLMDMARAMIAHAKLPKKYLGQAVLAATHILNICPHPHDNSVTPHEVLQGLKPHISYLRVFGCDAYAHIDDSQRTKNEAKAKKYIMIGYSGTQKGYKLYDENLNKIIVRRHVDFNENGFSNCTEHNTFQSDEEIDFEDDKVTDDEYDEAVEANFAEHDDDSS